MLYLVRHAHASGGSPDSGRPLSADGLAQVRRLAVILRQGGAFAPEEIWHSTLLRARQTAELLASEMGLKAPLREISGLEPDAPPGEVIPRLKAGRSVALVGHNPHLTLLGTALVTGSPSPGAFVLRKGSVLALEPSRGEYPGDWVVSWHLAPDFSE